VRKPHHHVKVADLGGETTGHATEKWVAIGAIACARERFGLEKCIFVTACCIISRCLCIDPWPEVPTDRSSEESCTRQPDSDGGEREWEWVWGWRRWNYWSVLSDHLYSVSQWI